MSRWLTKKRDLESKGFVVYLNKSTMKEEIVDLELKEQNRINDEFVEDTKKNFIESFSDLKVAGFSEKEIFELLN